MAAEHGTTSVGSPAHSRSATPTRPPSPQLRAPPESPVPKRPRARADALQVVTRVMTNDQIVAGLVEVHGLVTVDEDFAKCFHEAVDDNAIILEQVIARFLIVEQQLYKTVPEVGRSTADAKLIKEHVEQEVARLDKQIRIELDAMTAQLEGKSAELLVKLAALEGIFAQAQMGGGEPPGLAGLEGLNSAVVAIEDQLRSTLPRVNGIDGAQNNAQRTMIDLSRDFEGVKIAMGVEMEQMKVFITEGFASLQHSAEAAAAA